MQIPWPQCRRLEQNPHFSKKRMTTWQALLVVVGCLSCMEKASRGGASFRMRSARQDAGRVHAVVPSRLPCKRQGQTHPL